MGVKILNVEELNSDNANRNAVNTVFGQRVVAHEISAFNAVFAYPSDTRKLESTVVGTGVVTQENFMLKISTGTDVNGSALASSRRALKYQAGHEGYAKFTAIFTPDTDNSRQYIGLIDNLNGFAVGMEGSIFAVFRRRNGVFEDTVLQSQLNMDRLDGTGESGFNIDITKGNVFRVSFGFLGFAHITFEVLTDLGWVAFHGIKYVNRETQTHITLPYLKLSAKVENLGNNTDVSMYSGSVEAGIINGGGIKVSSRDFTQASTYSTLAGENAVIVYHNKPTYGGIENRIETLLSIVSAASDGTKTVVIERYRLATPPTGGTWSDISPNSVMEISEDSTVDLTGAELTIAFNLGKTGEFFEKLEDLNFRMLPDDYICYVVRSAGASEIGLSAAWKELF